MADDPPADHPDDSARDPRGGRPRLAPDEKRSERFSGIRLTAAERAIIEDKASQAGLSIAEYCRQSFLRSRPPPRSKSEIDAKALLAIERIGRNLNQIARQLNSGGPVPLYLHDTLDQVRDAIDRLMGPPDGA